MEKNVLISTREQNPEKIDELDVEKVKEEVIALLNSWCELDEGKLTRILRSLIRKSERARKIAGRIRKIVAKRIKGRLLRACLRIAERWTRFWVARAKQEVKDLFQKRKRNCRAIIELKNDNPRLAIEILEEHIKYTPIIPVSGDFGGHFYSPGNRYLIERYQRFIEILKQLKPKKSKAN